MGKKIQTVTFMKNSKSKMQNAKSKSKCNIKNSKKLFTKFKTQCSSHKKTM